ncbi:MAG: hypothetical protein ACLUV8_06385 [Clostridium sp.]
MELTKQEKTKYRLAASVKECMKTASVDKITVKYCGRLRPYPPDIYQIFWINTT